MALPRNYKTLNDMEAEYFREHPEEVEPYIEEIFEAYAADGDSAALLASLRVIAQLKGITNIANQIGMTRQGVQHALSEKGNPRLDNINAIMNALGYRLSPEKLESTAT